MTVAPRLAGGSARPWAWARRWAGSLLLLGGTLLLAEGLLQVLALRSNAINALLSPPNAVSPFVPDSSLGGRGNPRWYDHDKRGFRNPLALDHAEVVMLGDSHTYGTGVESDQTWPALVGAFGTVTYNMGFSGWAPSQGYLLLGQVLELQPEVVVYGLYFGNDFVDVYAHAAARPELRRFIPPALADTSAQLERIKPIREQAQALFNLRDTTRAQVPAGAVWEIRRLLSTHSRLYGLVRTLRTTLRGEADRPALLSRDLDQSLARLSEDQRRLVLPYRGPEWKTLLTPSYRNLVLDDHDPRIRAGVGASKEMLAAMDSVCRSRGVRFLVVLLPTKESVFSPRIPRSERSAALDSLVRNEARVHDELIAWMRQRNLAFLDVLPDLRSSAVQPYFMDADGHPDAVGHRVIARAVYRALRKQD